MPTSAVALKIDGMSNLPLLVLSPVVAGVLALSAGCGSTQPEATTATNTTTAPSAVVAVAVERAGESENGIPVAVACGTCLPDGTIHPACP